MSGEEDPLKDAFAALREEHDGSHATSDATLRQALLRTRKKERERSVVRWFVLPAAAALFAGTAFAAANGELDGILEALHLGRRAAIPATAPSEPEPPRPPPAAPVLPVPSNEATPDAPVVSVEEETGKPTTTMASSTASAGPKPRASARARHDGPAAAPAVDAPVEPGAAVDPDTALYEDAHRAHFVERSPEKALRAWDAYLAASRGHGRFVPEARYNRALSLVRLGRSDEAKRELAAFADGAYGDYRRREARDLLEALARDE